MAAVNLAPTFGVGYQAFDANGKPLNAGLINTYAAGTSTPLATYTTSIGNVQNANPIQLDPDGRPPQEIWLTSGSAYKFVLTDSASSIIKTYDNITGINDFSSSAISEWIPLGTPTFLSTTSFSLAGNQTSLLPANTRLKTVNTGGTIYSTIVSAVFTTITTVTVVNDAGVLDSGISAASYSLLRGDHPATPPFSDAQYVMQNSADATKLLKLTLDTVTTGSTIQWAVQSKTITVAGISDLPVNATTSDIVTGTNISRYANASAILGALKFSASFASAGQTISNGGSLTLAHGMARTPIFVQYYLLNTIAEQGWSTNDTIRIDQLIDGSNTGARGMATWVDVTNVNIRFSNVANSFVYLNKGTGGNVALTDADWTLLVKAWG